MAKTTNRNKIRSYKKYTEDELNDAVKLIKKGKISITKAVKKFKISKGTLINKIHNKHQKAIGTPLITYLDISGRNIIKIKDNLPSRHWARSFVKRHDNSIRERMSRNIKRSRAKVTVDDINKYFNNLSKTMTLPDGSTIPPNMIFNYDETNLTDDPGAKKCVFKRGVEYTERVKDNSKASISLMFCGSTTGILLPPYVVYKSEHLWTA